MNNKIYLLLIVLVVLFSSCKKALETTSVSKSSETLTPCQNVSCPEIDIHYITIQGSEKVANKINADIENFVIQSIAIGENETVSSAGTVTQAMEDFIAMYRTHSAEFPDLSAEYFAEVEVLPIYNSKNLLSVSCQNYLFIGGAHGNGTVMYKNYNPQTGAKLYYEDLFNDVDAFSIVAENTFRQAQEIPQGESINATGFWFEDDSFYLPETFGVSKEYVYLHYNPYEIASYAAGPIVLEIPVSEVKEILKIPVE